MPVKPDPDRLSYKPDFSFESALWRDGISYVAGIDEAGRGALAGPVSAGIVILPADPLLAEQLVGVDDSKRLTSEQREYWAARLKKIALAWEVGLASHAEIDLLGIVPAVHLAISRALRRLRLRPEHLLIDYLGLPEISIRQTSLVKGDQRSLSIAAASILAKTARDTILCQMDLKYPGYGFAAHKGYSTPGHVAALQSLGPCPEHRITYSFN
ncbi:MAG: ribonuclease HII [Anaerolineales bacterium]